MSDTVQIRRLEPGPRVREVFDDILTPAFPPAELCSLPVLEGMVASGVHPAWIAVDQHDRVLGAAVCEWDEEPRVMLLSWLAVRPGIRSQGLGNRLLDAAAEAWRRDWTPCVVLAEVEDPAHHSGSEAIGDPVARLRFYQRRGARILDLPYFQASLGPGLPRVPNLYLMVLHADPELQGSTPDTISAAALHRFIEIYQQQCEGGVATDPQALRLWRAIDSRPDGVPYIPFPV